jgi:hypothetical protein
MKNKVKVVGNTFPIIPPRGDMTRKDRMKRLEKTLIPQGLYVHAIPLDDTCHEWGYFIVSVDDPYEAVKCQGIT